MKNEQVLTKLDKTSSEETRKPFHCLKTITLAKIYFMIEFQ